MQRQHDGKKRGKAYLILCCNCQRAGGTMVKVRDNVYRHQDTNKCTILRLARRTINKDGDTGKDLRD